MSRAVLGTEAATLVFRCWVGVAILSRFETP